ncbi:MAG: hypothetical protein ACYCSP_07765 [Acidobacteriaceae bacterium]
MQFSHLANLLAMHDNMGMVSIHLTRRASVAALFCAVGCIFVASSSFGQKALVEKTGAIVKNTDINVNLYGTFATTATGNAAIDPVTGTVPAGTTSLKQSADSAPGFRVGVRHIFSPVFGLEANFGYNPAIQRFTGGTYIQDGVVYSHAKSFTIDYVATVPHLYHGFQPFFLGGAGLISSNISSYVESPPGVPALPVRPIENPVGEYGFGADYHPSKLPNFMSMRFQYRGLVGHAPGYKNPILATNSLINIAEPQVGLVFKF